MHCSQHKYGILRMALRPSSRMYGCLLRFNKVRVYNDTLSAALKINNREPPPNYTSVSSIQIHQWLKGDIVQPSWRNISIAIDRFQSLTFSRLNYDFDLFASELLKDYKAFFCWLWYHISLPRALRSQKSNLTVKDRWWSTSCWLCGWWKSTWAKIDARLPPRPRQMQLRRSRRPPRSRLGGPRELHSRTTQMSNRMPHLYLQKSQTAHGLRMQTMTMMSQFLSMCGQLPKVRCPIPANATTFWNEIVSWTTFALSSRVRIERYEDVLTALNSLHMMLLI